MLTYPEINPVALELGFLKVHWYGLMYVFGFVGFLVLGRLRARRNDIALEPKDVEDILFYGALGVILGGRFGSVLFYHFGDFLSDPLMLFRIWEGGMSFHGGLVGVILAMIVYAKKRGLHFFQVSDFIAPMVPIGLFFGRIGNFINGELWGAVTTVPWGMVSYQFSDGLARHPSQLYEAFLEGFVLFVVLWFYSNKPRPLAMTSGLFLLLYGLFRFLVEFVRTPDAHLGYLAWDWLTMGQVLSLPMIIFGALLMFWACKRQNVNAHK